MSRIKLTHSLIQQALPKEKPYALSDSCVPGLQLVVNPSGRKTFSFRSQNFRKALGIFPLMKVSASRREAIAYHEQHSKEIALKKRSGGQKNMMPLNSLIEEYFTFKQASLGAKTLEKYRYTWKKYASERLGSILISEITDTDINNLLMDLHQIKSCIKKLKLILVPAFRYARQRGHSVAPVSADNWMNVKSNSKERYFTCGELKSLFSLIAQRDENSVLPGSVQQQLNVFRLLVYTGCRVGEILSLQWKDVFLEDGYLQLWKTKTKKGRLVPLSDPLQKLMRNAQNHKINDYVFNSFMDSSNPMAHGTLTHTREEFVALTGDAFQAIVLNQFIYWVQKVSDFDDFIREEQARNPDCNVSLRHGWIYKKAQEMIDETMLQMSDITMRRIIKVLIEKGWIEERPNPDNRWNKVLQYRPDLKKIQHDLYSLGYALPGFPLLQPVVRSEASNLQNEVSNLQKSSFILKDSETTPEITAESSADTRSDISKSMIDTWNRVLCPPVLVQLTTERSQRLQALLQEHFENKLDLWSSFCQEITRSSFLMGKGQRGWRAGLDWVLIPANFQKIREGNYRDADPSPDGSGEEKLSSEELKLKVDAHLESLEDPLSRQFCRGLLRHLRGDKFLFWFGQASWGGWDCGELVLSFPSKAARDYVERHFSSEIGVAARSVCPDLKSLSLTVQQTIQHSQLPVSPAFSLPSPATGDQNQGKNISSSHGLRAVEVPHSQLPSLTTEGEFDLSQQSLAESDLQEINPQGNGEDRETQFSRSTSSPLKGSHTSPPNTQALEFAEDCLPVSDKASQPFLSALQTGEHGKERLVRDDALLGRIFSWDDGTSPVQEGVRSPAPTTLPWTSAEDQADSLLTPCFVSGEQPVSPTHAAPLSLHRHAVPCADSLGENASGNARQTCPTTSSVLSQESRHLCSPRRMPVIRDESRHVSSLSGKIKPSAREEGLPFVQDSYVDRNGRDPFLRVSSEERTHSVHSSPLSLPSVQENPWKRHVTGLLAACLPSSANPLMERNLS